MTYYNDPTIPRFQDPDYHEGNWCNRCDAVIDTDDMFETACTCCEEDFICETCGCEISEIAADEEVEFCEDCLCDYDDDDPEAECENCFYCLGEGEYNERKANGTLKPHTL